MSLQRAMAEKENDKRKLRAELEKSRKERNLLEHKMPTMDQNIGELQVIVDKMSREIDKETKKREAAVREKDVANEKLYLYQ